MEIGYNVSVHFRERKGRSNQLIKQVGEYLDNEIESRAPRASYRKIFSMKSRKALVKVISFPFSFIENVFPWLVLSPNDDQPPLIFPSFKPSLAP